MDFGPTDWRPTNPSPKIDFIEKAKVAKLAQQEKWEDANLSEKRKRVENKLLLMMSPSRGQDYVF